MTLAISTILAFTGTDHDLLLILVVLVVCAIIFGVIRR